VVIAGYVAQHADEMGLSDWAGAAIGYGSAAGIVVIGAALRRESKTSSDSVRRRPHWSISR
jgi:hypothetical protein